MKNRRFFISMAVAGGIGILLLVGLVFLEKKDEQEFQKQIETLAEQEVIEGKIFLETEQVVEEASEAERSTQVYEESGASLLFAGDVYLSGYVTGQYDAAGMEGVLEQSLLAELQEADILMVNEEFPFGTGGTPAEDKQYTFLVNPSYTSIFSDMGVDIVSLANNHVLDYGQEVLQETFHCLSEKEIIYAGAGNSVEEASALRIIEAGGKTYGFLAASRVIPVAGWNVQDSQPGVFTTYDKTALVAAIETAKQICDYVTVYVHWGIERNTTPEAYQKELAHAYIDAGADMVIGAHPHVLQGIEAYNGKLIFYSLGNFIFNQSIEKTMLVKVSQKEEQMEYSIIPAYATGAKTKVYENTEEFYSYLEGISEGITIDGGKINFAENIR